MVPLNLSSNYNPLPKILDTLPYLEETPLTIKLLLLITSEVAKGGFVLETLQDVTHFLQQFPDLFEVNFQVEAIYIRKINNG